VPVEFHDNTHNQLGNINYWHWNFGDPGSGGNNESFLKDPVHSFATAGNYLVTLAVASEAGCKDTIIKTVIIRQSADVDFAFTDECDKDAVYFTDLTQTQPFNNVLEWHWDFGDGYTSNIQNPSHLYEDAGEYEVVLSVKTLNGCTVSISKAVVVNATPQPDFVLTDICAAVPYQFIDNSYVLNGYINEWEWQIINLDTQYVKNPVFTFPAPGSYTVKLITTTQAGCKDSISRTVTVYKSPTADFSFSPKFGVAPLTITFTNKSEGGISYHWNFGDGTGTSLLKNPSYTFTENGIYNISLLTYNENDCYDSMVKQLKIIPSSLDIAVKEVDAVVSNNYLKVSAELINLGTRTIEDLYLYIETSQGGSIRESWTGILETGDILSYEFTAEIPLNGQTIDYVCVRAANPDQPIDDKPANDEKCKALVEDFILLEPYPNPTDGILNIPFILPMADDISIVLYSASGSKIRELYSGEGTKGYNIQTFDFSKLAKGMYACQLRYRDKVKVVKFVKE
jgi:PKD repeat protein